MSLQRVSKKEPCLVCGKDSWCMIGDTASLCMRVTSNRQFTMKNGDVGYWHGDEFARPVRMYHKGVEPKKIDAVGLASKWFVSASIESCSEMANRIGVSLESICMMMVGWSPDHNAWTWPMRDGQGNICGIRLRAENGRKWCVTGSRQGLFEPISKPQRRVFMPEGGTDCAALLSIGVYAIGRPSCSGGIMEIKQSISRLGIQEVVIVADNDQDKEHNGRTFNPGYDGSMSLQNHLTVPSCVLALPTKDAREFVREGGTKDVLDYMVRQAVWNRPT